MFKESAEAYPMTAIYAGVIPQTCLVMVLLHFQSTSQAEISGHASRPEESTLTCVEVGREKVPMNYLLKIDITNPD